MSASTPVSEPICNEASDRLPRPRRRSGWIPLHYGLIGLLHAGAVLLFVWLANHPGSVLNTGLALAQGAATPVRATLLSAQWLAMQRHGRQKTQPAANPAHETSFVAAKPSALQDVPPAQIAAASASPQRRPALPKRRTPQPAVHQTHPLRTHSPALASAKPRTAPSNSPRRSDSPPERASASAPEATIHALASSAGSPSMAAQSAATGDSAVPVGVKAATAMPIGGPIITQAHYRQPPQPEDYPPLARRRGWQGTVLIEVWLDADGEQLKRQILQSSGHAVLDQAALRSVARNQFAPYTLDGIGQPARLHLPVIFSLSAP